MVWVVLVLARRTLLTMSIGLEFLDVVFIVVLSLWVSRLGR